MMTLVATATALVIAVAVVPGNSAPQLLAEQPLSSKAAKGAKAVKGVTAWCDMAALVARMQPVPLAQDPVFRRPTPIGKEKLQAVRAMVANAKTKRDQHVAKAQLRALYSGREGPVLARLSLQMTDAMFRAVALGEVARLAKKHPRLASFAGQDVRHADPSVASGAVRVLLASRCDTAAHYALEGLLHADPRVRRSVATEVLDAATVTTDIGLVGKLLAHIGSAETDSSLRAAVYRKIGAIGWLPAAAPLASVASQKKQPALVRCEAAVAHAVITGDATEPETRQLLASKSPWLRLCGVRVVAAGMTGRPTSGAAMLKPLMNDKNVAKDPLGGGKAWRVGEAARIAAQHLLLK
jgi:hypothetical protein